MIFLNQFKFIEKENQIKYFTVKFSSNLFVGKLGLTLNTWDGETSGIVPDDDAIFLISEKKKIMYSIKA